MDYNIPRLQKNVAGTAPLTNHEKLRSGVALGEAGNERVFVLLLARSILTYL